jgi:hypothetical protein
MPDARACRSGKKSRHVFEHGTAQRKPPLVCEGGGQKDCPSCVRTVRAPNGITPSDRPSEGPHNGTPPAGAFIRYVRKGGGYFLLYQYSLASNSESAVRAI